MKREPVELDKRKAMGPARRRRILERQNGVCAYPDCEVSEGLEIDHVIALALGGKDSDENLEGLCRHHHAQKTRRDVKMISKAKRIEKKQDRENRKPSQLQSRGFDKRWRKKMNGQVVRREP